MPEFRVQQLETHCVDYIVEAPDKDYAWATIVLNGQMREDFGTILYIDDDRIVDKQIINETLEMLNA